MAAVLKLHAPPDSRECTPTVSRSAGVGVHFGKLLGKGGGFGGAIGITLPEVYRRHIEPGLRTDKNRHNYRWALNHWTRVMGDPDVGLLADEDVTAFVRALGEGGLTPNSVRTVMRHIRACLNRCGARDTRNRKGLDLVERVPFADADATPAEVQKFPNIATADEIAALYRACEFMDYHPRTFRGEASAFWRFQLVMAFIAGLRTIDIMLLTRGNFLSDAEVDASEMLAYYAFTRPRSWPHGWLVYVPEKTKAKKPLPIVLPLHPAITQHLAALESLLFVPDSLFGVTNWRSISSGYYEHAQHWASRAGLKRKISLKHVRKASNTMWNRFHGLGEYVLGHAPRGSASRVNAQYYDACIGRVCEAMGELPLPAEFERGGVGEGERGR